MSVYRDTGASYVYYNVRECYSDRVTVTVTLLPIVKNLPWVEYARFKVRGIHGEGVSRRGVARKSDEAGK